MNRFDFVIIHFLNSFAHRSWGVDAFISVVEESDLLKGGIGLAFFFWAWFRYAGPGSAKRESLLFAFISSPVAILIGRAFSLVIPFRERPFHNPFYQFQLPYTVTGQVHSWNSAPSDHAVLFFCLATTLFIVSRPLGILALLHALFVVCLPRIYVGYHYPTDIIAGALLGTGAALACQWDWLRQTTTRPVLAWMEQRQALFYALAFVWTFEVAELFGSLLSLQSFARRCLAGFLAHHL